MTHRHLSQTQTLSLTAILPYPDDGQVSQMGHYHYLDLSIVIEVPKGDYRRGVSADGAKWATKMTAHYGYIDGTTGADGEEIDIYVGPLKPDPANIVYLVTQVKADTKAFDEFKVFLGFSSINQVKLTFIKAFSDGKGEARFGGVIGFPYETFLRWLSNPHSIQLETPETVSDPPPMIDPAQTSKEKLTAEVDTRDAHSPTPTHRPSSIQKIEIPRVTAAPVLREVVHPDGTVHTTVYILSPFTVEIWGDTAHYLIHFLYLCREGDVVTISLSSPGGEINLAVRIASAIRETKALVRTICIGPVASAATLLWAEGHERYITPGSYVMQHMSSHASYGNSFSVVLESVALVQYLKDIVFVRAIEIGLLTPQEIVDMVTKEKEIFLTPTEIMSRTQAILLESWT